MGCIRIMVETETPDPQTTRQAPSPVSIEEQVRDALDLIESGHESEVEWIMINKLYNDLCKMSKKSPRIENLISLIEPVLQKYGFHGVAADRTGY